MLLVMQIEDVYITTYETCGLYWPYIHHYIIVAIILMQVTMIGLFGLKAKPSASFSVIPLLVVTILFNEYCKIRPLSRALLHSKEKDEAPRQIGNKYKRNVRAVRKIIFPVVIRILNE